jgi:hypothetical protein
MPLMTNMTKKRRTFGFIFLLTLILIAVLSTCSGSGYKLELIRSDGGWGYDILANNKLYIHQPYMPAVEGKHPFSSRQFARKTGRLVIRKLKNHKVPSVTRDEIKDILEKS